MESFLGADGIRKNGRMLPWGLAKWDEHLHLIYHHKYENMSNAITI